MIKNILKIILISFCFQQAIAQELTTSFSDLKAQDVLQKGKYEINGGFTISTGESMTKGITASVGYFLNDEWTVQGNTGIISTTNDTYYLLGIGSSYYFYKHNQWALYGTQVIGTFNTGSSSNYGETHFGVNYLVTKDVGFKFFGRLEYPIDQIDKNDFKIIGSFSYFL
jgi:hypothetical protein